MVKNSMTTTVGRLLLNPIKRAFWDGANNIGCDVTFSEGPHGWLSFTVPIKITWTGTEEQVNKMTAQAKRYMYNLCDITNE